MSRKILVIMVSFLLVSSYSYAQQKIIKTEEDLVEIKKTKNSYEVIITGVYKKEHFKSYGVIYVGKESISIYPDGAIFNKIGDISKYDGKFVEVRGFIEYLPEDPTSELSGHWIRRIDSINEIERN